MFSVPDFRASMGFLHIDRHLSRVTHVCIYYWVYFYSLIVCLLWHRLLRSRCFFLANWSTTTWVYELYDIFLFRVWTLSVYTSISILISLVFIWAGYGPYWQGGLQKEEPKWLDHRERSYRLPTTHIMYHIQGLEGGAVEDF